MSSNVKWKFLVYGLVSVFFMGCGKPQKTEDVSEQAMATAPSEVVKPALVSEPVQYDSDDPAFWINKQDLSNSLVIGTDKGGDNGDGALYVFNLQGKIVENKTVHGLKRPNNVDIAYDMPLGNETVDVAVCTERNGNTLRVFRVPEMEPIDQGGIPVFEAPMGIALYTAPDGALYAIISRKAGPSGSYLWQYRLDGSKGYVTGTVVRKFGTFTGNSEIESVAVDNELGYLYYSNEGVGVRKYYAHPDSSNTELALFGEGDFMEDAEGISIFRGDQGKGYILVSDQQANRFQVYPREGTGQGPHHHPLLKTVYTSTISSDGSDVTSVALPAFPHGLFVAMSDDKTFQFYRWEDMIGTGAMASTP